MLIRAYNRRRNLAVLLAKEQEAQGSQAGDGHTGNGDQREVVRRLRDGCRRLGGRGRCTVGRGVVRRVICGIVGRIVRGVICGIVRRIVRRSRGRSGFCSRDRGRLGLAVDSQPADNRSLGAGGGDGVADDLVLLNGEGQAVASLYFPFVIE